MEWLVGIVVVGVILFYVLGIGAKMEDSAKYIPHTVRFGRARERKKLLDTWRREVANILIWHDPDRYLGLYRSLHAEVSAYKDWKPAALQAKRDEISERYPDYEDFDSIGTLRIHVLYPDVCPPDEELEAMFADITRFQGILCATDPDWKGLRATSDGDLSDLIKYVAQIKDTKFRLRLERAISDYYVWSARKDEMTDTGVVFDYGNTTVRYVDHVSDNCYGVHFKDTNEYGLYSFFVHDDNHISERYYRSDSSFQEERLLDVLLGVAEDYRNRLQSHHG